MPSNGLGDLQALNTWLQSLSSQEFHKLLKKPKEALLHLWRESIPDDIVENPLIIDLVDNWLFTIQVVYLLGYQHGGYSGFIEKIENGLLSSL